MTVMDPHKITLFILIAGVVLVLNFVPSVIAFLRRHPERRTIAALNVASLVSFLLWGALLAWAVGGGRSGTIDRFLADPRNRQRGALVLGGLFLTGLILSILSLSQRLG